jgi:serine/threonine protein phosphatase PrpC
VVVTDPSSAVRSVRDEPEHEAPEPVEPPEAVDADSEVADQPTGEDPPLEPSGAQPSAEEAAPSAPGPAAGAAVAPPAGPEHGAAEPVGSADGVVWIPLTGSSPRPREASGGSADWRQHPNGRWIVGDPGRQLDIEPNASRIVQTRPDLSVDWAALGAVEFRAASIRGLGHFADGKPRQDACGVAFAPNNRWLVGCVADGVSAATHAHQAADFAVSIFTLRIGNDLADVPLPTDPESWPMIAAAIGWQAATDEVSREINSAAQARFRKGFERSGDQESLARLDADGLPNHDARQLMATTAVAFTVATSPLPDGRVPFAVVVAAGDSSAMILSEGAWHPISAVKNDGAEVASSAVSPLPMSTAVTPVVGFLEPGQALAVITDGIGDPLGSGTGVVGRFLAERWLTPPDPIMFANDIAFYRKSFVDDRTAVLVWVKG